MLLPVSVVGRVSGGSLSSVAFPSLACAAPSIDRPPLAGLTAFGEMAATDIALAGAAANAGSGSAGRAMSDFTGLICGVATSFEAAGAASAIAAAGSAANDAAVAAAFAAGS